MPYGGIYLIGGVTAGLDSYLKDKIANKPFIEGYKDKGRHTDLMGNFPIYVVDPDIEVGLNGAIERALRE